MNSELNQLIDDCEKYISQNGIDENIIETYYNVCQLAKNEGEIDTMLKCTARAKELINGYCTDPEQFDGKTYGKLRKLYRKVIVNIHYLISFTMY